MTNEECAAAATRESGITTIVFRPPYVIDLEHAQRDGWILRMIKRSAEQRNDSLWGYIDMREPGRAYRLALESTLTGHHVCYTMADDVSVDASAPELAARHLPHLLSQAEHLPGNSFYDLAPARKDLGFVARYTWRQVLGAGNAPL